MEEAYDPKAFLLFALQHFDLPVRQQTEKVIHLKGGYAIEIEGPKLFKLLQDDQVVAPFDDVEEMCRFIRTDQQLSDGQD